MIFVLVFVALTFFCRDGYSFYQEEQLVAKEVNIEIGEEYINYFPLPVEIKYDSENIYVLDADDNDVKVFEKNGKYVDQIGRKGRGPGEFDMPSGMDIFEGKIYIADKMNRRIQIINKNGDYLNGFNTKFSPNKIVILRKDRIIVSFLPLIKTSEENMIFCFTKEGRLLWKKFESFYSGDRVYDVFQNRLDMGIKKGNELVVARKNNDRNLYIYSWEGILLDEIRITNEYIYKDIVLPVGKKKRLFNLYGDSSIFDDKFYLLSTKYTSKRGKKDLIPGDKIYVFDINGKTLCMIQLPVPLKLISIDQQNIYGIGIHNKLRIFKIRGK